MSDNNYIHPYYFMHPPPNYNVSSNSWSYSWKPNPISQNVKEYKDDSAQNNKSSTNYLSNSLRTIANPVPVNNSNYEQRTQNYYNSASQEVYTQRRYNNNENVVSGQYNNNNSTNQYSIPPPPYTHTPVHYSTIQGQYLHTSHSNYIRNSYNKRKPDSEMDGLRKPNKKKKKPLSQNIPQRKDWSVEDAKRALMVEKDYNKRHKSQSLIIKFPDLELNRDIVSKFHPAIESVHFQQPSTPRFCFVNIRESADPEEVIKELNKVPFGDGFLTAEFKKDREDEVNIGPEDIDPLTLYVGNLAQEVTKEDMVNTYPKQKRIDIGYAKKMKYTRYAFVSFKSVDDTIEAFQRTHATQMYSKSLIVRFRRLHGTVGMPGEPKPQMPQRTDTNDAQGHSISTRDSHNTTNLNNSSDAEAENYANSSLMPWEMVDVSNWRRDDESSVDMNSVKHEPQGNSDDDAEYNDCVEFNESSLYNRDFNRSYDAKSLEKALSSHKPLVKVEVKKEKEDLLPTSDEKTTTYINIEDTYSVIKKEALEIPNSFKIKRDPDITTDLTYKQLVELNRNAAENPENIRLIDVKKEIPSSDETSSETQEAIAETNQTEPVKIKDEPEDKDEDSDSYGDDSSDNDNDAFSISQKFLKAGKM